MQKFTDSQRNRVKNALFSAVFYTVLLILGAAAMLALRQQAGSADTVLLILSILDLGLLIPLWIQYYNRYKEIEGGEEDAAAQY